MTVLALKSPDAHKPYYAWFRQLTIPATANALVVGPSFDSVLLPLTENTGDYDASPADGAVALKTFNGVGIATVTSSLDYAVRGSWARVRPSPSVNLLRGLPLIDWSVYPYARVNLEFTGTPVSPANGVMFVAVPDKGPTGYMGVGSGGTASRLNKTGDPYAYHGSMVATPPVVRGSYNRAEVELPTSVPSAYVTKGETWVWLDGICDAVDKTKIKVSGVASTFAEMVAGFGGQLLRVIVPVYPAIPTSGGLAVQPNITFEAGALTRGGQPNIAQSVSQSASGTHRFVQIGNLTIPLADASWFETDDTAPVMKNSTIEWQSPIVPCKAAERFWSSDSQVSSEIIAAGGPDRISLEVAKATTASFPVPANPGRMGFGNASPPVTDTQVIPGTKAIGSANHATRDRYRAIVPMTCSGHKDPLPSQIGKRTRFRATYATPQTALIVHGDVWNVTKDQWTTDAIGHIDNSDINLPLIPEATTAYLTLQCAPTGWANNDVCWMFEHDMLWWTPQANLQPAPHPGSKTIRPSVRVPTGVYPLCKSQSLAATMASDAVKADALGAVYSSSFGPASGFVPAPKSVNKYSGLVKWALSSSVSFTTTLADIQALFDAMAEVDRVFIYFREYSGPFAAFDSANSRYDRTQYALLQTIMLPGLVMDTQPFDASTGFDVPAYSSSTSYSIGNRVAKPTTVARGGGTLTTYDIYSATISGLLPAPPAAGWSGPTSPYNSPFKSRITTSQRIVYAAPSHALDSKVGFWLATVNRPLSTSFGAPFGLTWNCSVGLSMLSNYPLHLTALRDSNGVYEGRIWTGEPVIPFLA